MNDLKSFVTSLHKKGIHLTVEQGKLKSSSELGAIDEVTGEMIKANKIEIMRLLESFQRSNSKFEGIKKAASDDNIPLSFAQQRLWLLDKIDGGGTHYNMPVALKLSGDLDTQALNRTFAEIVERHESLRTCFRENENKQPIQQVMSADSFKVEFVDLSSVEESDQAAAVRETIGQEANKLFKLNSDLMIRVQLLKLSDQEHVLLVTMHHIATDGWSLGILITEFSQLYTAFSQGLKSPLAPLNIQYADYAYWQRNWLQGEVLDKQLGYWTHQLADLPISHGLPLDKPRPLVQSFVGKMHNSSISKQVHHALNVICKQHAATIFMGIHAAFSVLLSRYSNETDIVVGSPIVNREQPEIAPLIGFFMNNLVLRSDLSDNPSFSELITRSKHTLLDAYAHQQVPFEQIVEKLQPERSLSHSPLFQVMLILQNNEKGQLNIPGLDINPLGQEGSNNKYDLTLIVTETDDGLSLGWDYNTDLFNSETIARMAHHFERLLEAIVLSPTEDVFGVQMLSADERKLQLEANSGTAVDYPKDKCIQQIFEAQVLKTPEATAITYEGNSLTYAALNQRANQLANYLVENKSVGPNTLVGICVERSLEMMIGLLAILKAGGAYVPLDPSYPTNRLDYIIKDSGIKTVLTQSEVAPLLENDFEIDLICLDELNWSALGNSDNINPQSLSLSANNLAYLLYTSGSTGNPKGVMVKHQNVINFFAGLNQTFGLKKEQNTWLAVTSINFDISVLELFWTLSVGDKVVIQPDRPVTNIKSQKMDFSLFYFAAEEARTTGDKYQLLMQGAKFSDENGFAGVWVPERHFASFGDQFPNPSVAAAAVAATTSRIKIRAGSVVLPLHDPIRVAEEWSMVDNFSNGRVEISVASGWHPNDFVLAPNTFTQRHQILKDNLGTLHQLWQGESIKRINGVGNEVEIQLHPSPVQAKLPTWITAGGSPDTFRYAGSIGANLLTHLLGQSSEELAEKIAVYRDALEEAGYDRNHGKVALMLHTFVSEDCDNKAIVEGPLKEYLKQSIHLIKPLIENMGIDWEQDPDTVLEFAFQRYYQTSGLFGTPASCTDKIAQLNAIGVDEIACLIDFGIDNAQVMSQLPQLAKLQKLCKQQTIKQELLDKRVSRQWSPLALIEKHNVTHLQSTPTFVNDWSGSVEGQQALSRLNALLVGGEAIAPNAAENLLKFISGDIYNMYGPTETTVWSAIEKIKSREVLIGHPMANTQFYVVDKHNQLVPQGMKGELCIAGDGVSNGYFNLPELTKGRFVKNSFSSNDNSIMYKTGDMVLRLASGQLQFLGRIDEQIKLNGFRIELGEIEKQVDRCKGVHSSLVLAVERNQGKKSIIAYLKLDVANSEGVDEAEKIALIRQRLSQNLPDYMLPSAFVIVDEWPLTPNGKIDRKSLPDIDEESIAEKYVAPVSETEKRLLAIWAKLLERDTETLSVLANFFMLGGHSLLAIRLVSEICREFDVDIEVRAIFESPIMRDMASAIDRTLLVKLADVVSEEEIEVEGWL